MRSVKKTLFVLTVFCVAMAALESAVVVYLRALYYPDGFTVAFKLIDEHLLLIEIVRELATLIMLLCIAYLSGQTFKERFSNFLLSFAIWDIAYYAWLKIFIEWPLSFFEWDILFLVPITWLGPVVAPIICSLTMIILATVLHNSDHKQKISNLTWSFLIGGSCLILFTFTQDYLGILTSHKFWADYTHILQNKNFITIASSYIPAYYNWKLFLFGEVLIILAILSTHFKNANSNQASLLSKNGNTSFEELTRT